MKLVHLLPIVLGSLLLPTVAQAEPGLSTSWQSTTLSLSQCLNRAENALRDSGFSANFQIVGESAFGGSRDDAYVASVRCLPDQGIVFFIVSGPISDQAASYRERIAQNF